MTICDENIVTKEEVKPKLKKNYENNNNKNNKTKN